MELERKKKKKKARGKEEKGWNISEGMHEERWSEGMWGGSRDTRDQTEGWSTRDKQRRSRGLFRSLSDPSIPLRRRSVYCGVQTDRWDPISLNSRYERTATGDGTFVSVSTLTAETQRLSRTEDKHTLNHLRLNVIKCTLDAFFWPQLCEITQPPGVWRCSSFLVVNVLFLIVNECFMTLEEEVFVSGQVVCLYNTALIKTQRVNTEVLLFELCI